MTEDDVKRWREVGFDYTRPPPPPVVVDVELVAVEPEPHHKNGTGVCSLAGVREAQRLAEAATDAVIEKARAVVKAATIGALNDATTDLGVALRLLDAQRVLLRAREEARR